MNNCQFDSQFENNIPFSRKILNLIDNSDKKNNQIDDKSFLLSCQDHVNIYNINFNFLINEEKTSNTRKVQPKGIKAQNGITTQINFNNNYKTYLRNKSNLKNNKINEKNKHLSSNLIDNFVGNNINNTEHVLYNEDKEKERSISCPKNNTQHFPKNKEYLNVHIIQK